MSAFAKIVGLKTEGSRTNKDAMLSRFTVDLGKTDFQKIGCWRKFDNKYLKPIFGGEKKSQKVTLKQMAHENVNVEEGKESLIKKLTDNDFEEDEVFIKP